MSVAAAPLAPEIDQVVKRVYQGRQKLWSLGLEVDTDGVRIIVSNDIWAKMLEEHRKLVESARDRGAFWASALMTEYACDGHEMRYVMRLFGILVESDSGLMPHEIRFRSEVTI